MSAERKSLAVTDPRILDYYLRMILKKTFEINFNQEEHYSLYQKVFFALLSDAEMRNRVTLYSDLINRSLKIT